MGWINFRGEDIALILATFFYREPGPKSQGLSLPAILST